MWRIAGLVFVAALALAGAASAACDCGADQCTGQSVNYPAPSWSDQPIAVSFGFNCNGGDCVCGQYINGDYWVVDNNLTITSTSPAASSGCRSGGTCRNGYWINPTSEQDTPYDDRVPGFDSALHGPATPFAVQPNDVIIKSASRSDTLYNSVIQRHVVLSVVSAPPANPKDLFRTPYYARTKPSREYRYSQLDFSAFPRVSGDPATSQRPSFAAIRDRFRWPQIDHVRNYFQRMSLAVDNTIWQPDGNAYSNYDMERERDATQSILRFMLDDITQPPSAAQKEALVGLLQFGLDMGHAMNQGVEWWEHGRGRMAVVVLAARLWNDAALRQALTSTGYQWNRSFKKPAHSVSSTYPNGVALFVGRTDCSEREYWQSVETNGGGNQECPDPYGYIDGGYDLAAGEGYLFCCNTKPLQYTVLIARLLGARSLLDAGNPYLGEFADRWRARGNHALPDPCAPFDGNTGNYGRTYGPAPGNSSSCSDTQSCSCIQGSGRFAADNGDNRDAGYHNSVFGEAMWDAYWNFSGGGSTTPPPTTPPPLDPPQWVN